LRRIVFIVTGLLQAALGLWLETTTVPKVVVMAQIKGWLPGARPAVVRVADKWHSSYGGRDAYWISWGEGDVRIPGNPGSPCASESGAAHRSAINSKSSMLGAGLSTSTAVAAYSQSRAISCSTAYCCLMRPYLYGSASAA